MTEIERSRQGKIAVQARNCVHNILVSQDDINFFAYRLNDLGEEWHRGPLRWAENDLENSARVLRNLALTGRENR